MTFEEELNKIVFGNMATKQKTQAEITRSERIRKIKAKAAEMAVHMFEDMDNNKLPKGDSGVYHVNNAWVVKKHSFNPRKINFNFNID